MGILLSLAIPGTAPAAAPEFLWQTPADSVMTGSATGQLNNPRGMVADPETGHLYVVDSFNSRISEFTAWGAFVKAWGWDVSPDGAPGDTPSDQLETCTTTCQAGSEGSGAGQLDVPQGVTRDETGNLYVYDLNNNRVQKFSPSGQFLLMFGGGVNTGTGDPNVCTNAGPPTDVCGAGTLGNANGQLSNILSANYISYNPVTDSVFVGGEDRIDEFETDGTFKDRIDFEGPEHGAFDGRTAFTLAADPVSGDLYVSFRASKVFEGVPDVYRLDPATGEVLDTLEVNTPDGFAVDVDGNLLVVEAGGDNASIPGSSPFEVLGFDASGKPIEGMKAGDEFAEPPPLSGRSINGLATNAAAPGSSEPGNLYVDYFSGASYINAYGPPPLAFEDPPLSAPTIGDQYAVAADTDGALVKGNINPRFWPDATYRVQYGTEQCIETGDWEAACVSEDPAAPGTLLTAKSTNASLTTPGVFLGGLVPDTTYRYRFVARSTGSGGEDVFGVGGTLSAEGTDAVFTTFPLADALNNDCPNQTFRTGPGEKLPDCRAYEMVSPLDKNNGDISTKPGQGVHQSSITGSSFTYTSNTPFGAVDSAPVVSQYVAKRDPGTGWQSEAISPPRTRMVEKEGTRRGDSEYDFFSPDLCSGWIRGLFDPPLAPGAVTGYQNYYRRENCSDPGSYEALTTVQPPSASVGLYGQFELQGVSADGTGTLFAAPDSLTPDAPSQSGCTAIGTGPTPCLYQLYLRSAGEPLRFLCVLPSDIPIDPGKQMCVAGTAGDLQKGSGLFGSLQGALSGDGKRVYFTARSVNSVGGRIYLRLVEAEETLPVSQTVSGAAAFFWAGAREGEAALFEIQDASPLNNNLYRFDVEKEASDLIAEDTLGVLGASQDLSRIYFVSEQALPGSGESGEGEEAAPGEPNLYLYEQGEPGEPDVYSFIGTLSGEDTASGPTSMDVWGVERTSRVSPSGQHAAFISTARLTGYDNTDAVAGKPVTEAFLYDAAADELRCVSCNPSGIRPTGGLLRGWQGESEPASPMAAAQIPGYERALYASRLLSEDGTRLFFESYEALVVRDTNGVQDVYQWEEAGAGDCDQGDSTFSEEAGGCVDLISSGESPQASFFRDASPSGKDVFFATLSSLLPEDYGLVDVYDARVGGGLPPPPPAVPGCEGEACQGPIVAPDDPTPGSSTFEGSGNVTEQARPTKCAKGRRAVRKAGKTRCVKKPRKAKRAKRANTKRRAAR